MFMTAPKIALLASSLVSAALASVTIQNNDPLIFFHGRWDSSPGTWWAGSGLKLNVVGLSSLTLNLGSHTSSPMAAVGVSVNFQPFFTVNVTQGSNKIPLGTLPKGENTVVRLNVEGWQNNRINLQNIVLNTGAKLLPYVPSKLAFTFIGDSLSAGQFLPLGVDQAWPFLTGEFFKAEHTVIAQPGAALSDIVSFSNQHGLSFEFFRTEDDGYFFTTDHNFTTPWDFSRDHPTPTHIVIHIGANDSAQNISASSFIQTYLAFIKRLRTLFPKQPLFIFTPWGWPNADGSIGQYYPGAYQTIVNTVKSGGDKNIFLVDTTGWVTFADVFPTNQHPNVGGHMKIAANFEKVLTNAGVKPQANWATPIVKV
ncbi:SGNH hydrolase [Rickenella mellea]|uniref:SGNH hydrolase n=1 Tax=Rickenella mellea TaxID=50990 RepID=A0A4Y7QHE0_9AGAM|nr:SGNH hydrolase [Rickenella mellea]